MTKLIEITDFEAPELDNYARLSERELRTKYEPNGGIFIAESPKVITRALDAGCEPVSLLMERRHAEGEAKDIIRRCGDIPVYVSELETLTKLTGFQLTRGVLCAMKRPTAPAPEAVCEGKRRIAVLDEVMNPTNLGAIFRSAAALGIGAVLLTPGCCDPLYRRAIRVSMGNVFLIPWAYLDNSSPLPEQLRDLGFRSAAMALRNDALAPDDEALRREERLALILGTEGDGLADATVSGCDYTVCIPMAGEVDSLNVAAAAAVAFWAITR